MYKCQACYGVSYAVNMSRYRNENDSLYVKKNKVSTDLNSLKYLKKILLNSFLPFGNIHNYALTRMENKNMACYATANKEVLEKQGEQVEGKHNTLIPLV